MSSSSPASTTFQHVKLPNGVTIPSVAFGCAFGNWTNSDEFTGFLPELAWSSIPFALDAGYTHFDGAFVYGTERHVGITLGKHFANGTLKRSDVFLTTKLAHPQGSPHLYMTSTRTLNPREYETDDQMRRRLLQDFDNSLDNLGVGYVDLLLMHWPGDFNEKDKSFARAHRLRVWKVFEELYAKKAARAIGVCNFTQQHFEDLIADGAKIIPMVNQIELHPYCQDSKLVDFCTSQGVVVEAYAPLASGAFNLLKDPVLSEVAKQVKKSVGQVILRWHLQHGHVILPKSSNATRAKENLDLFDWSLSDEQMKQIDNLHPQGQPARRSCPDPNTIV